MTASTFPALFEEQRRAVSPRKPLLAGAVQLSYGEVFDRGDRLLRLLSSRGVRSGERVLVVSRHERELVSLFLGLLRAGVAAVVLDPELTTDELRAAVAAAGARGVFADAEHAATLADLIAGDRWMIRIVAPQKKNLFQRLLGRPAPSPGPEDRLPALWDALEPGGPAPAAVDGSTCAVTLYAPGPRPVEITHDALASSTRTLLAQLELGPGTRLMNPAPLHHPDGLLQGVVAMFGAGGTLFRSERFSVPRLQPFLESIYLHALTHAHLGPAALELILRLGVELRDSFTTPDFRFIVCSSPPDPTLWRDFEREFATRIVQVHAYFETAGPAPPRASAPPEEPAVANAGEGDELEGRVIRVAARCLGVAPERLDARSTPDNTQGWDSLAHMNLVTAIEQAFSISLEPRDILELESLGAALRIVDRKLSGGR